MESSGAAGSGLFGTRLWRLEGPRPKAQEHRWPGLLVPELQAGLEGPSQCRLLEGSEREDRLAGPSCSCLVICRLLSLLPTWACASSFLCGPVSACPAHGPAWLQPCPCFSVSSQLHCLFSSTSCPPHRLPADTTATVEDMLPSVTTVTANSDTITETFATAQNSPTSETTTLTSSIAPPANATPDSNSVPTGQPAPSKGPGTATSAPSPASTPKVAPLVDLSDTPTSAPAASNLSSSVLANQGAVLSPSAPASVGEASKANKPTPAPGPAAAGTASPLAAAAAPAPEVPPAQQEAPSTKGPDPEPSQPGAMKSPAEATTGQSSPKSEVASVNATNPAQGEDFKMDEGNFKTPDIDLAKDVFAALGSPAPATGASGQAPELAPSTADSSVPPAPAKTEYGLSLSAVIGLCPVVVCVCAVLCPH